MKIRPRVTLATSVLASLTIALTGCGSVVTTSGASDSKGSSAALKNCPKTIDAAALQPDQLVGVSPRGGKPSSPDVVELTDQEKQKVKDSHFKVGIAMQTEDIDYSTILIRSFKKTFEEYGVEIVGITDGQWNVSKQQNDIQDLIQRRPDGIMSVPTDSVGMASTYKSIHTNMSEHGTPIKFVQLDDISPGLEHGVDFATSSGMDQKGMGQIAMEVLAECIPKGGTVGIVAIDIQLWAANQREDGAVEWLKAARPDIKVKRLGVTDPNHVTQLASDFITANPDVQGLWTPWDGPGLQALSSLRSMGSNIPVTTQDLGTEFAMNVARGTQLIGGGAQELDAQGRTHALALISAMLDKKLPEYIAHPALVVTKGNLMAAWKQVWGTEAPADLVSACKKNDGCA
jgi:ribose transport system substrate-binding protein